MKNILFIIDSLNCGGAERGLINLINSLDTSKYKLNLLLMNSIFDRAKEIKNAIELKVIDRNCMLFAGKKCKINDAQNFVKCFNGRLLRKLVNIGEYDVEFLFMDSLLIRLVAGSSNDTLKILRLANDYSKPFEKLVDVKPTKEEISQHFSYYDKMNYIISPSMCALEAFKKRTGAYKNLVCIYNINKQEELQEAACEEVTDIRKNEFTICTVGRLTEDKGALRIVNIAKKLNEIGISYEWWIIGKGECEFQIRDFIKKYKLDNVKLLGYKSNPFKYMRLADLYVSCSYFEGLSNAAKEAMLLGLPCVVTDCSGMKEIFGENNEYGIVTENTEDALYKEIKLIIENEKIYNFYKKNVLLRQKFFSPQRSIEQYEKMFEGVE